MVGEFWEKNQEVRKALILGKLGVTICERHEAAGEDALAAARARAHDELAAYLHEADRQLVQGGDVIDHGVERRQIGVDPPGYVIPDLPAPEGTGLTVVF